MGLLKAIGWIFKTPLIVLVWLTLGLGFYAAAGMLEGFRIGYTAPIVLTILIILYMIGTFMTSIKANDKQEESNQQSSNVNYDQYDDAETRKALAEYEDLMG